MIDRCSLSRTALAAALGAVLCGTAWSQDASAPARKPKAATLQTVVVTGTRALDRTAADSLAPIDVLTPADLARTGATDLNTALRDLLPSFNFPQPSITDATDATQPAQLRGLSPDETLVLIDGKRQHTTAIANVSNPLSIGRGTSPVDLSAIPINAIERIEVLRDGAAAQYGSDAIAGVINIILKGGAQHGSANAGWGIHDGGQGVTRSGGADGGFALGAQGWVHLSANVLHQDPTNRAGPDPRYPGDPTFGTVTVHYGLPYTTVKQGALNAQYTLGPDATLYAFSVLNKRRVDAGGAFRAVSQFAADNPAAAAVYPRGFLQTERSAITDDSSVLGVRGDLAGWHYDVSAHTGGSHWKLDTSNTFNYSLGAASPTSFYIGTLAIRQNIFNADLNRDFDVGMYSPLNVAWGLAWQQEAFTTRAGEPASYYGTGAQGFPGFQPLDAGRHDRHNAAAYIDLEGDLTDKFSAGLAARHEHYSDFGNTISWKLSGRYAFTPTVALRATASTGFRAPSLQQEYYASTALVFDNAHSASIPYVVRTFPVSDPAAVALGAQPLKAEKSHNFSMGLVFTPEHGPYTTLDLYQIDISDRIILSGELTGPAVQSYLTSVGIPYVDGGQFFTNAANTRTRGADLIATWPMQVGDAQVKLTGGANWNQTRLRSIKPNPPQLGLAGLVLPVLDRTEQARITVMSPRSKLFAGADWTRGAWTLHGQLSRYGGWQYWGPTPQWDQAYGPRVLLDLSASYAWRRWDFTVGGDNVTNVYPDRNNAATSYLGILAYPASSPFGFNGAYWYARASYRW